MPVCDDVYPGLHECNERDGMDSRRAYAERSVQMVAPTLVARLGAVAGLERSEMSEGET